MVMWVSEMGNVTGKRPFTKFSCSLLLKQFLFLQASHRLCYWIILTKATLGMPSCKSLNNCSNTKETSLSVTFTGIPEITIWSLFVSKTKPVLTSNSSYKLHLRGKNKSKGNNNCWLEAWLTVMFVKIAHIKPADVHAVGLQ
jgi:hypothetical protein